MSVLIKTLCTLFKLYLIYPFRISLYFKDIIYTHETIIIFFYNLSFFLTYSEI
ncbi:hypothetical protein PFMC_00694, partial [Plasmodium falciparum CAMP/Malaysia]